jgi:hypothetical protein
MRIFIRKQCQEKRDTIMSYLGLIFICVLAFLVRGMFFIEKIFLFSIFLFAFEEKADKNFHWDHLKCNAE